MVWEIRFEESVKKELKKIDRKSSERIILFLRDRVATSKNPRNLGESLKGSKLGEFWRYRIGDYRIIADIQDSVLLILVLKIGHRRDVYK